MIALQLGCRDSIEFDLVLHFYTDENQLNNGLVFLEFDFDLVLGSDDCLDHGNDDGIWILNAHDESGDDDMNFDLFSLREIENVLILISREKILVALLVQSTEIL